MNTSQRDAEPDHTVHVWEGLYTSFQDSAERAGGPGQCARAGYQFVMKTFATGRIPGVEGPLPMDHFPETHRLERSLQILLRHTS